MSGCHVSPSLRKIEWMTFSTDRSVITSVFAIEAFDFPRGVSAASRD
jgi:hypothetical protein